MRTLREDGVRKVLAGLTTADEVISSTMADSGLTLWTHVRSQIFLWNGGISLPEQAEAFFLAAQTDSQPYRGGFDQNPSYAMRRGSNRFLPRPSGLRLTA
jgi:hypothetical protein